MASFDWLGDKRTPKEKRRDDIFWGTVIFIVIIIFCLGIWKALELVISLIQYLNKL